MDQHRLAMWRQKESAGEYLRRMTHLYLIWDPEKHHRVLATSGKTAKRDQYGTAFGLSSRKIIQRTLKQHVDLVSEFESLLNGIESAMIAAGLDPQRMDEEELFLETKRALSPQRPDRLPLAAVPILAALRQLLASSVRLPASWDKRKTTSISTGCCGASSRSRPRPMRPIRAYCAVC